MRQFNIFFYSAMIFLIISCGDKIHEIDNEQFIPDTNQAWSKEDYKFLEEESKLNLDEKFAKARTLNDEGVTLLESSYPYPKGSTVKDSLLFEALNRFDKAINEHKDYYYSYYNKANVLIALKRYDAALKTLEELLKVKENYPVALFHIGMIYEKSGNRGKAHQYYKIALKGYEEKLKSPIATQQDSLEKDQVLLFVEGKEKTLERINGLLLKDPQNVDLMIAKKEIEKFDRNKFFENF